MYARPELEPAFDALWTGLRRELGRRDIDAPEQPTDTGADLMRFCSCTDLRIRQTIGYQGWISRTYL